MRSAIVVFVASAGVAVAAACSSSSDNNGTDGGGSDGGGSSSSSSSGGRSSSSSGGLFDAGTPMQIGTRPTSIDGGIHCAGMGMMGECASPQLCCWGDQSQTLPPLPGCTTATSCSGSSIACSATNHCATGQVCCFVFTGDAGAAATTGPFTAQCADQCPTGDMVHYQLCASDSDCPAGNTCSMMAPYSPYCMTPFMFDGGRRGDGAAPEGGQSSTDASDAGGE
jgi:hypothetical protein